MPYADEFVRVEQKDGEPLRFSSALDLEGREGFVVAPFIIADDCPLLLIRPDIVTRHQVDEEEEIRKEELGIKKGGLGRRKKERAAYHNSFNLFHDELQKGRFRKIVLARRSVETFDEDVDAERLFLRACKSYPRMFVALVSTPQSGTWLMATPEVLVREASPPTPPQKGRGELS
jgi:isochorismate synthase